MILILPLILTSLFILSGFVYVTISLVQWRDRTQQDEALRERFRQTASFIGLRMTSMLNATTEQLLATSHFCAAMHDGDLLSNRTFFPFTLGLTDGKSIASVATLAWLPRLTRDRIKSFEQEIRDLNGGLYANFTIKSKMADPENVYPFVYASVNPTVELFDSVYGLDVWDDERRRHSIITAVASRQRNSMVLPALVFN